MKLCTAAEMMETDRQAIQERGIPGVVLMENAGRACCREMIASFGHLFPGPLLVVAGKGNNGGDGYVIARILSDAGWQVKTVVLGNAEDIGGDALVMLQIMQQLKLPVSFVTKSKELLSVFADDAPALIVDAVFGTGLNSDVRGLQAEAIQLINEADAAVVAVDIPSGVNGSNGRVMGDAVKAELTVTFDRAKIGHGSRPGADYSGTLAVVDIGIPLIGRSPLQSRVQLVDEAVAAGLLPHRPASGHKGRFGHLLVVAGSQGKSGAAALAGNAAVRSGCGLITVAVPACVHDIIEVKLTEAMGCSLEDEEGLVALSALDSILALARERQALAIGPGLGVSDGLRTLLSTILEKVEIPVVIDADGLNLLSGQLECLTAVSARPVVLTPHPGEMSRLTGLSVVEIESDRFEVAKRFAQESGAVILLKGARTVIAAPDGRVNINSSGNDGLSSGGSGDVLTGVIGGLLAQGLDAFEAASLGAWLHGRSAELVSSGAGTAGMAATDLLPQLPVSRQELVSSQDH